MSDIQELLAAVRAREERIDQQIAELRGYAGMTGNQQSGNTLKVTMASPDSGERAAHKAEKVAIGLACLLLGLLFGGWSMVSDLKDAVGDQKRQQQRTDDYLNMLWRTYPETREAALKAQEDSKNGKPDNH